MSTRKKELIEKTFAQNYVANGMNAKQAVLAIKGHLTPGSASVEGSRLLDSPNVQSHIQGLSTEVLTSFSQTLSKTVDLLDRWILDDTDFEKQQFAIKQVNEMLKSLAPATKQPSKHQHLHLPK